MCARSFARKRISDAMKARWGERRRCLFASFVTHFQWGRRLCCKFQMQILLSPSVCRAFLDWQIEEAVDELNLIKKIISCHPSSLPLPDNMNCFVALNRSPSRLEFSEALLGVHPTFDGSMILFENVVQVLHRSVSTALA